MGQARLTEALKPLMYQLLSSDKIATLNEDNSNWKNVVFDLSLLTTDESLLDANKARVFERAVVARKTVIDAAIDYHDINLESAHMLLLASRRAINMLLDASNGILKSKPANDCPDFVLARLQHLQFDTLNL